MKDKISILYVDDEEINLRAFKNTFRFDYKIYTVESGFEAIDFLKSGKVDIIITDQKMPKMTGVELLKNIKELFPDIPPQRLMISGFSEDSHIAEAKDKYLLFKYIKKPWKEAEIRNIISEVTKNINNEI